MGVLEKVAQAAAAKKIEAAAREIMAKAGQALKGGERRAGAAEMALILVDEGLAREAIGERTAEALRAMVGEFLGDGGAKKGP